MMVQKYTEKARRSKQNKREETRAAVGRMHIEERRTKNDWTTGHGFCESKNTKTKQNKRKRSEDTNSRHLWLPNYGNRTSTGSLALGYPLLGPSRHVRAYLCMP